VVKQGLSFGLQATDAHIIGLTLPDGRTEIFDLVVTPQVSPLVPFPPSVLTARLVPRPGTLGKLESLENNTLSIFANQPGPVELLEDVSLDAYMLRTTLISGCVSKLTSGDFSKISTL